MSFDKELDAFPINIIYKNVLSSLFPLLYIFHFKTVFPHALEISYSNALMMSSIAFISNSLPLSNAS